MEVKRKPPAGAIILASMVVVVASFFLPWVQLLPPGTKKIPIKSAQKERASGLPFKDPAKSAVVEFNRGIVSIGVSVRKSVRLSGFKIPQAANSDAVKAAGKLAGLFQKKKPDFTEQLRQAGFRAYAVYLLPLIHAMCGVLLFRQTNARWIVGVVGFIAFIIPPIVFWQVSKALAQSNGLAAADYGLRLSLFAYWGLTYAAALMLRRSRQA